MKPTHRYILILVLLANICIGCGNSGNDRRDPIILGDSADIVTEHDEKYLGDFVADIQLQKPISHDTDTVVPPEQQTVVDKPLPDTIAKPAPEKPLTRGLNIPFKEVTVNISGITTKTYRQQNLEKANGATYELVSGNINGSKLTLHDAAITKVSQRYTAVVMATNENKETLLLDALSETTGWTPIKGNGNTYSIGGLDASSLKPTASASQIKAAVTRAAKNKRLSGKKIRQWEQEVRNVRSVNQAPLSVKLRSVMWKVEGKDKAGKTFQKQVRIDIPL